MDTPSPRSGFVRQIEWIAAAGITLAVLHLHFLFLRHAGALWRDEVSSVDLATLPGLRDVWSMLTHDSFPLLWSLLLRIWTAIGLGDSDFHLRWIGFLAGTALLAAVWMAGLLMRSGPPLLALALFALNATTISAGDSLRAYGLGTVLIILTLALVWRFYENPTARNAIVAGLVATLSVQCLYQNAFFLLAAGLSASALAALQRQWRKAAAIIAIGIIAGFSLLPYVAAISRSQDWWMLEKSGFHPAQLWIKASQAIGFPRPWFNLVWVAVAAFAAGIGGLQLWRLSKSERDSLDPAMQAFAAGSLLLGLTGFILFLKIGGLPTQPWYYLPLMGFTAICADRILSKMRRARVATLIIAMLIAAGSYQAALPIAQQRQTNVDLLATHLAAEAGPNDLIVVNNWYCGVTFQRYYHGTTPWLTVPPLRDLTIHRYDLIKAEMQKTNAIDPVLAKIEATLRAGNRVWLLGRVPLEGNPPPVIQAAPHNPWGWLVFPYTQVWAAEFGYFLTQHATGAQPGPVMTGINPLENVELASISGWR